MSLSIIIFQNYTKRILMFPPTSTRLLISFPANPRHQGTCSFLNDRLEGRTIGNPIGFLILPNIVSANATVRVFIRLSFLPNQDSYITSCINDLHFSIPPGLGQLQQLNISVSQRNEREVDFHKLFGLRVFFETSLLRSPRIFLTFNHNTNL